MGHFKKYLEVLAASLKLGLTSFGGPTAHLGFFQYEYVDRRRWLDEKTYADLVALCQFLPGPASSQLGIAIGTLRAGTWGGLIAWLGFTLPSALFMAAFALVMQGFHLENTPWLHGLRLTAVAIVALAVYQMAIKLAAGKARATIALSAALVMLLWHTALSQVLVIILAGLAGFFLLRQETAPAPDIQTPPLGKRLGIICLVLFLALLAVMPVIRGITGGRLAGLADSMVRSGALVFGGGHVVLPLLEAEVVLPGWVSRDSFSAGYGAAQAVPGPLFTFSAYLGAVYAGPAGAVTALLAIFLPAWLLIMAALPFWDRIRRSTAMRGVFAGVNAGVVGLLAAALYNPLWVSTVKRPSDLALALLLFGMMAFWKLPPWSAVIAGALLAGLGGLAGLV